MQVVHRMKSQTGGHCNWCKVWIPIGVETVKVADGKKRSRKHGPGSWVCVDCAIIADGQLVLEFTDGAA